MNLGLDISVVRAAPSAVPAGQTPPGSDPAVQSIDASGWRASYLSPGTFDPVGDPRPVVVERPGHDGTGVAATVTDVLTVMSRVREPWPNQATWTPSDVALSDFVYAGDTTPGVFNGSTRPYPKPQALWLNHDLDVTRSTSYTVRLAVAHAHARKGRPVAAVRFTATDGISTVETTVTTMSVTSHPASGLSVPHFAGTLDLSLLQTGMLITIDAEIRPWVGPAFTISTGAEAYPSINLTTLKVLNDHDDGYGTAYAYIDAVSGNDTTGAASAVAATAKAAPFATIGAAVLAVNQFNSTNFGRTGVSGGVIRLEPGVHTHAGFGFYAVSEIPLVIEAADPAQKAATIYRDAGASVSNGLPDKVKLRNLTLRRNAAGSVIFLDSNAVLGSENMLVAENCTWDGNGLGAPWNAWVYRVGRFWNIGSDGEDLGQCRPFSTIFKACISIGSAAGSLQGYTYHAVGCRDLGATTAHNTVTGDVHPVGGDFFAWNHMGQGVDGARCLNLFLPIDDRGIALVGNVFEHFGGATGPVWSISADGVTAVADNVNVMCNTSVGARTNVLYQDAGTVAVTKHGRCRFNADRSWNSKDDTFAPENGNRTGNWSVQYRVGFRGNAALEGSNKGTGWGAGDVWLGEAAALDDVAGTAVAPLTANWADDRSFTGTATGGGDYTPGLGHQLPSIAAGLAPYGTDQLGRTIADDGTAVAGALQP